MAAPELERLTGAEAFTDPAIELIANEATSGLAGKQDAIQFQDEGAPLGVTGTADTVNFVGAGVLATRAANVVTVTIGGGGGSSSSFNIDDFLGVWSFDELTRLQNGQDSI